MKQAIVAAVKFNDDCFGYFSREPTDYDKRANHAIAMAKQLNPGYLPSTYRQARWWVTYLMKYVGGPRRPKSTNSSPRCRACP